MTTPYDSTPDPAFEAGVKKFAWQAWMRGTVQIGWLATGSCPRCGHTMAAYRRRAIGLQPGRGFSVSCNCTSAHPGRPEGVTQGCGQSAYIAPDAWPPAERRP
jgi:hypothetical protein